MFEVSEEERSRQKLEQKRRKDAKKKKKEEEKSKQAASKNDVIADILTNMPLHVGTGMLSYLYFNFLLFVVEAFLLLTLIVLFDRKCR